MSYFGLGKPITTDQIVSSPGLERYRPNRSLTQNGDSAPSIYVSADGLLLAEMMLRKGKTSHQQSCDAALVPTARLSITASKTCCYTRGQKEMETSVSVTATLSIETNMTYCLSIHIEAERDNPSFQGALPAERSFQSDLFP